MHVHEKDAIITMFEFDFSKREPFDDTALWVDGAYIKKPVDPWDNPWRITSCDVDFAAFYYMFNGNPNPNYRASMIPFQVGLDYNENRIFMHKFNYDLYFDLNDHIKSVENNTLDIVKST